MARVHKRQAPQPEKNLDDIERYVARRVGGLVEKRIMEMAKQSNDNKWYIVLAIAISTILIMSTTLAVEMFV
jgi:hypothetical protein